MFSKLWSAGLARLPPAAQFELRRANYLRQIRRGRFVRDDPEVREITHHVGAGDWVVDVGANVGRHTFHMAQRVGVSGRVLAFEPVSVSFTLLAANVRGAGLRNVTLFNVALSSGPGISAMTVPTYQRARLRNYYRAHLEPGGEYPVLCLPLDAIPIPCRVRLVKIDAEGHDLQVLMGMKSLLHRDRPILVVEGWPGGAAAAWLKEQGYSVRAVGDSPNIVATSAFAPQGRLQQA
ncbi:MAG TPA: FkbM family methyltransferase [Steroidobacteraceae bacterium]|nr:FkbM family methyltransferase [Steroidobacteraceae bacterium]